MTADEIRDKYTALKTGYTYERARLIRRSHLIAWLRLTVFAGGGVTWVVLTHQNLTLLVTGSAVIFTAFLGLVSYSYILSRRITWYSNLININESEIRALDGDYTGFNDGSGWIDDTHDYSSDIDLFGKNSLFRYLNRTVTGFGREKLAGWLTDPQPLCNELINRQEAIRELAGKLSWRQQFMAHCMETTVGKDEVDAIIAWLADDKDVIGRTALKFYTLIIPLITLAFFFLMIAGLVAFQVFSLLFILNLAITGFYLKRTNRLHAALSGRATAFRALGNAARSFENEQFASPLMAELAMSLRGGKLPASESYRKFGNIIRAFDNRINLFAGAVLNGLILWDMQCISRFCRWKDENAQRMPVWINHTAVTDALISLANYHYNNPGFVFPEMEQRETFLEAAEMGHPLISSKTRITNNFSIARQGIITIITGANMAGKSTFLRTAAVNLVLAMAGAPVCASIFRFTPSAVFTSMRNTDSLADNESFFYAELIRLKALKERIEAGEKIIFLLDEIMKGTNSADKSTGSKLFIRKMIASGATGIVATHDLSMGELNFEFPENIVNMCFEVFMEGDELRFDFKLRPGITTTMNAVLLMKRLGLT